MAYSWLSPFGDAANKIGTLGVAILARHFNIPFYVACPSSTVDLGTPDGSGIVIEERQADEVLFCGGHRTGPEGAKVRNPAFDVTPQALIAGFITDKGILRPPYAATPARVLDHMIATTKLMQAMDLGANPFRHSHVGRGSDPDRDL